MGIIQEELDQIKYEWNNHTIRIQRRNPVECPSGKPEIMFFYPELYGIYFFFAKVNLIGLIDSIKDFKNFRGMKKTNEY